MHFNSVDNNNGNGKGVPSCGGVGASGNSDSFTVKRIMGRTPGLIKSKFLSVLDTSNGLLNGLSSKVRNGASSGLCDLNISTPLCAPNHVAQGIVHPINFICSWRGSV